MEKKELSLKRRVLIIDDEALLREIFRAQVEDLGYEAIEVPDGQFALHYLKENIVDTVVTDLQMPNKGGIEFLQEFRAFDSETPVVILTGYATKEKILEALRLGATDFLDKPIDCEQIRNVLYRLVELGFRRRKVNLLLEELLSGKIDLSVAKKRYESEMKMNRLLQIFHNSKT